MADFVISNLDAQEFTFENISFKKLVNNDSYNILVKKRWQDEYYATFTAVADDNLKVRPIIQDEGLKGVVNDICLLLSLAQSRCIYCPEYTINEESSQRPPFRGSKKISDKIVGDNQIESYLSNAVQTLRKPEWIQKTGFIPAIYYLMGGKYPELGDVEFILTWIALETLANTHSKMSGISNHILPSTKFKGVKEGVISMLTQLKKGSQLTSKQEELIKQKVPELNRLSIRSKVNKLRSEYGWDFITDELFNDWNKLRNHIMHTGTYAGLNQTKLIDLSTRLRVSMQLILIDMLDCSNYVDNLQGLKTRIRGNK